MKTSFLILLLILSVYKKPKEINENVVVVHSFFILSYNIEKKNPNWVCWEIHTEKRFRRENFSFKVDPLVMSASPKNFRRSGYDMGHMCPAADMSFDKDALRESFYTSNISPQSPGLNRVTWKKLESDLHSEAGLTNIYCICGPVWPEKATIGAEKVQVPKGFWKVAFGGTGETVRAWIFENRECRAERIDLSVLSEKVGIDFNLCTNTLLRYENQNQIFKQEYLH